MFYFESHEGLDSVVINHQDGYSEESPVSHYICPSGQNKALSALCVVNRMEKSLISNFLRTTCTTSTNSEWCQGQKCCFFNLVFHDFISHCVFFNTQLQLFIFIVLFYYC